MAIAEIREWMGGSGTPPIVDWGAGLPAADSAEWLEIFPPERPVTLALPAPPAPPPRRAEVPVPTPDWLPWPALLSRLALVVVILTGGVAVELAVASSGLGGMRPKSTAPAGAATPMARLVGARVAERAGIAMTATAGPAPLPADARAPSARPPAAAPTKSAAHPRAFDVSLTPPPLAAVPVGGAARVAIPPPPVASVRAPAPVSVPKSPGASSAAPSDPPVEDTIRGVLNRYRTALGALDVAGVRSAWPGIDTDALERSFAQARSELEFAGCDVAVQGRVARAVCRGTATTVPRNGRGQPRTQDRVWSFNLSRLGGRWIIEDARSR